MFPIRYLLACVLLLGLVCNSARADSAFLALHALNAELFDLDPADGIAAHLTLSEAERSGSIFQYQNSDASWPPLREDHVSQRGAAAFSDASGSASIALLDESMRADVVSTGGGAYTALLTNRFLFTLTPHTRVVFSSLTESAADAAVRGSTLAVVTLSGQLASIPGLFVSFENTNVRNDSGSSQVPIAVETVAGDAAASGEIALRGFVYAASSIAPVPEPAQYAMLLAGLLWCALAVRRRTKAGAALLPRRFAAAAGTLALVGAVAPGLAQASSGSASIRDFSYELTDLDLTDGVMPLLTFTSAMIHGDVFANQNTVLGNPWDETRALRSYGTASIDKPQGRAMVELSSDSAHAEARAWRGAFSADGASGYTFMLTPHTGVVFSAIAELVIAHDHPTTPPDMSDGTAGLFGEIFNFPGQRTQLNSYISSSTPGRYTMPLAVHAFTGDLAGTGDIRVTARTFAIGVSPIPEPRAWAMLAAGLALVLIRIKRCIVPATPSAQARE